MTYKKKIDPNKVNKKNQKEAFILCTLDRQTLLLKIWLLIHLQKL
jgi:hypothetical protein